MSANTITRLILDTSVLIDMLCSPRPRHPAAKRLQAILERDRTTIVLPYFALFEVAAATKSEKVSSTFKFPADFALNLDLRPIDLAFFRTYYDPSLPNVRAGDLVFLALAKHDALPLVTEDVPLRAACRSIAINVYGIEEYVQAQAGSGDRFQQPV
jgi:predicted nucleic acid-binding protein